MSVSLSGKDKREALSKIDEGNLLCVDGFDDCIIGYVEVFNKSLACYSRPKVIKKMMKRDKMTFEEAVEYFEFNIIGAYMGELTPAFLSPIEEIVL